MVTLPKVLADACWVIGLAGLLATGSYAAWLRSLRGERWREVADAPGVRFAFWASLTAVAAGALLNGLLPGGQTVWWQVVCWVILFFFFIVQFIQALFSALAGVRVADKSGWASSTEGNDRK
jgi:hypothetical protein